MRLTRSHQDPAQHTIIGASVLAGAANVIMQLAWPEVGYGVVESRVDDGNVYKHPVKRTRTTLTYVAVAMLGTEDERKAYRRAINGQHAKVRSTDTSPVRYHAMDPELQLWVAACLYRGVEDIYRHFIGDIGSEAADQIYADSAALGTTLQVRPQMWPASRQAFEDYWTRALERVSIDDTVRAHLTGIANLRMFPRPLSILMGRFHRFVTTGFLPPLFREQMRLDWSDRDQRRFERLIKAVAAVSLRLPVPLRQFPYNFYLWDFRRRLARGTPLV